MRDAEPPRYRRRVALLLLLPLLLLALFAGGVAGQQQQQPSPDLRGVEDQLTGLTKDVAKTIADSFSFCVADPSVLPSFSPLPRRMICSLLHSLAVVAAHKLDPSELTHPVFRFT
jgi:hypothetical protein